MQLAKKRHELTINISARSRTDIVTDTVFFTMDVDVAQKIIHFTLDNNPLDLRNAIVLLGFHYTDINQSKSIDSVDGSVVIEDAPAGRCSVMLPNHMYAYSGRVLIHAYIFFSDGRSLDAGIIVTHFEESWLDSELEEMETIYVKRFEDLAREIKEHADVLKQKLGILQTQANNLQTQITSGQLVTRPVHEAHAASVQAALNNRAMLNHTHSANEINVGVLAAARIPTNISITGNATTATRLQTPRMIGGVNFDGTANINLPGVNALGTQSTTGNAATATRLQVPRLINGVNFDGTANITITANPNPHTHSANDINGGVLHADRIPNLPAARINSGLLNIDRIPVIPINRVANLQAHVDGNDRHVTQLAQNRFSAAIAGNQYPMGQSSFFTTAGNFPHVPAVVMTFRPVTDRVFQTILSDHNPPRTATRVWRANIAPAWTPWQETSFENRGHARFSTGLRSTPFINVTNWNILNPIFDSMENGEMRMVFSVAGVLNSPFASPYCQGELRRFDDSNGRVGYVEIYAGTGLQFAKAVRHIRGAQLMPWRFIQASLTPQF